MNKKNKKLFSIIGIALILAIGIGFSAVNIIKAFGPTTQTYNFYEGSIENFVAMEGADEEASLGGSNYNRVIDFSEGISVDGTTVIDGDGGVTFTTGAFTGLSSLTGGIVTTVDTIVATTTLTTSSANVQLLAASAVTETITLPAATDGARFSFVVTGALTGATAIIDSAEGDNINGAIMVNDAWVNCVDEDQINFITDGELIGDNIEMISDGTGWYIVSSEVDASAKMTCTDPS